MNESIKKTHRPPYGILAVLMVGTFITFLNNTLLNIALPSIMKDLDIDTATVQWLTTVFMLVSGVLIPTTAFLFQKFSVRQLFLAAMGIFAIGTIIAGSTDFFSILLIGRIFQAAGAAIMMPVLMNVMLVSFPIEKRGAAMGVFGLIIMFAPAIGPTLSGWIIEHYHWRMLFHFITPIAIVVILIGFFSLKDKKDKTDIKLDLFSLLLSSIGFGGLLFGFSSAGSKGWNSALVYLPLIIGMISLIWFILRQTKQELPMLNFSVFKYPMFSLSATITIVLNIAMFSGFLLLPIYVQTIRGISPLDTGLLLLPGALLMAIMSPIIGRLFDKFGGRMLAIIGLIITTITTYYFSKLTFTTPYNYLVILHAVRMLGISMVMMPVSTNGLNQLPASLYPHGTAMNNTINQVSAAIGTALLVTVMSNYSRSYAAQLTEDALKATPEAGMAEIQEQITMKAMLEGINYTFFLSALIACFALLLSFFIKRAKHPEDTIEGKTSEKSLHVNLQSIRLSRTQEQNR
ncbi:DHA2 family efflux MFS transporter permease subunit [Bacillus sp. ISL-7]|uniref:DHA2 family efflux MFS transporter permease subunit n=1 Tax=Bacillus sp. ISL-7 TaxID=2819136 RepID=UPI001BE788B0|nr:DHA2 family efflux MFS transporter permease subunit [Bacillus sp. ISL-7]MBT2738342.1 DHA2 family efflux MFS transporter permease subunit [Bacillus sp. ISL-7]